MQFNKFAAAGTLAVSAFCAVAAASPALAAPNPVTSGKNGILSGNQVIAPIAIPISVCGNAVSVLGVAGAGCEGGAEATNS